MVSVFVSHSKHDVEIRKFFAEIFSRTGLKAKFMEWEDMSKIYAGAKISKMIRAGIFSGHDTSAVFVLLGRNVATPPSATPEFTHNWVAFEAGAAAGCLKPVWVFEDYSDMVNYPVPFVTDYVNYELDNVDHLRFLSSLFEQEIKFPSRAKRIKPYANIKCPYENCNARYRYWNEHNEINCPVCRRGMTIGSKE